MGLNPSQLVASLSLTLREKFRSLEVGHDTIDNLSHL